MHGGYHGLETAATLANAVLLAWLLGWAAEVAAEVAAAGFAAAAATVATAWQQALTQQEAAEDVPDVDEAQELGGVVQGLLLRPLDTRLMSSRPYCDDWGAQDALRGKRPQRLLHCSCVSKDGNML
jgi:hypothetical protein